MYASLSDESRANLSYMNKSYSLAAHSTQFLQTLAIEAGDPLMPLQQLSILVNLWTQGEMSQSAMEGLTNVTGRATNARNIQKLGDGNHREGPGLGLVEQVEDRLDKRAKRIRLTPRGREVCETASEKTYGKDGVSLSDIAKIAKLAKLVKGKAPDQKPPEELH